MNSTASNCFKVIGLVELIICLSFGLPAFFVPELFIGIYNWEEELRGLVGYAVMCQFFGVFVSAWGFAVLLLTKFVKEKKDMKNCSFFISVVKLLVGIYCTYLTPMISGKLNNVVWLTVVICFIMSACFFCSGICGCKKCSGEKKDE